MTATMSDWRKEVPCKVSGEAPILYQTKITKTKVIPLYRLADSKGETQDVVTFLCDSFDAKTLSYSKKVPFPIPSLIPFDELSPEANLKLSQDQLALDMIHNCKAFGIEVQDGIKQEGWKQFSPVIALPATIPIDDLTKYYKKEDTVSLEDVTIQDKTRIENPLEVPLTEGIVIKESEKVRETPRIVVKVDPATSVFENEPSYHLVPQPKGKKGRPKKVYDDPEFDALVKSIPHSVACKGCGKDIIINPLNIIDRARAMKIEALDLVSGYKCRSCK